MSVQPTSASSKRFEQRRSISPALDTSRGIDLIMEGFAAIEITPLIGGEKQIHLVLKEAEYPNFVLPSNEQIVRDTLAHCKDNEAAVEAISSAENIEKFNKAYCSSIFGTRMGNEGNHLTETAFVIRHPLHYLETILEQVDMEISAEQHNAGIRYACLFIRTYIDMYKQDRELFGMYPEVGNVTFDDYRQDVDVFNGDIDSELEFLVFNAEFCTKPNAPKETVKDIEEVVKIVNRNAELLGFIPEYNPRPHYNPQPMHFPSLHLQLSLNEAHMENLLDSKAENDTRFINRLLAKIMEAAANILSSNVGVDTSTSSWIQDDPNEISYVDHKNGHMVRHHKKFGTFELIKFPDFNNTESAVFITIAGAMAGCLQTVGLMNEEGLPIDESGEVDERAVEEIKSKGFRYYIDRLQADSVKYQIMLDEAAEQDSGFSMSYEYLAEMENPMPGPAPDVLKGDFLENMFGRQIEINPEHKNNAMPCNLVQV